MIDFIKNIFRSRCLRRNACHAVTGLLPLSGIGSASIFIDAESDGRDRCASAARAYFKAKGIGTDIFFFDFRKRSKEERQTPAPDNTLFREDLTWYGCPAGGAADKMLHSGNDLFISLIDNTDFPITYLAGCSAAKFKIGRRQLPGHIFDLIVEDSASRDLSSEEAFAEITKYLEKIG